MTPTNWTPGLVVLGIALVVGAAFVLRTLMRGPAPALGTKDVRELEARYRAVVDQLKELKADEHHLEPATYAAQRAELEARAAATLRDKEARTQAAKPADAPRPAPPAGSGFFSKRPELKGALWGGGVVAFFVLVFALLIKEEKPNPEPIRGQAPMAAASADQPDELATALDHVRAHPEDVEASAAAAHELIRRQRWADARGVTEKALGIAPFSVEHRIHREVLMAVDGNVLRAIQHLQRIADFYTGSHEALLFLASMVGDQGDEARALESLERYVQIAPPAEQSPQIYAAMTELRQRLKAPPSP